MADHEYKSLNKETGLIEDIDEVREAGIRMSEIIYAMMAEPLMALIMPPDIAFLLAAAAVTNESHMRPMSQAELVRKLASLSGGPLAPMVAEMQIQRNHLSETLPYTHPDAPQPQDFDLRGGQSNRPTMPPVVLDEMSRMSPFPQAPRSPFAEPMPSYQRFEELGIPPQELGAVGESGTELSEGIEAFLRALGEPKEETDGGDQSS